MHGSQQNNIEAGCVAVNGDAGSELADSPRVLLTEEDVLDKIALGLSAIFGLREDTQLEGNQHSVLAAIAPVAQLAWQPVSSVLIVKVRPRILMPAMVLGWGIAQVCMPACRNFAALLADRFFLGLFEAGCLPLFSIITSQWYRRSEQPIRVALWFGTNGLATMVAAILSYALGRIESGPLAPWQWIYLVTGLLTVVSVPLIYWRLDDDRAQALERLRANQTGAGSQEYEWKQVLEMFLDIKCYFFAVMSLAICIGAQMAVTFGPLILKSFGFDKYKTTLLNIPFGALQCIIILSAAWVTVRTRWKSLALGFMLVFILTGLVLLYTLPRDKSHIPGLLIGYYLLAFTFGCFNLIVSWILANTAGQTKKSTMMAAFNAAAAAGAIVGPLLFDAADAPEYRAGIRSTLGVFAAMFAAVLLQVGNLMLLNKLQVRRRIANNKPAYIHDHSMEDKYVDIRTDNAGTIGDQAFADLTDRENDEFVYVY
ncbi:major facilitator superfamily domain-containing protein [Parachaetomium inaequale]|uniref:Major facilitator superfamily domain-containing protein n=1 Tax=Parachaetomium inaequale TaxID=2588326 RepID=A0AAN6PCN2_9PEZI|nr:major facilitator superfamily domain-containing protein [Parachaetomium inaequale]